VCPPAPGSAAGLGDWSVPPPQGQTSRCFVVWICIACCDPIPTRYSTLSSAPLLRLLSAPSAARCSALLCVLPANSLVVALRKEMAGLPPGKGRRMPEGAQEREREREGQLHTLSTHAQRCVGARLGNRGREGCSVGRRALALAGCGGTQPLIAGKRLVHCSTQRAQATIVRTQTDTPLPSILLSSTRCRSLAQPPVGSAASPPALLSSPLLSSPLLSSPLLCASPLHSDVRRRGGCG
jgi:hypothetical protein